MKLLDTDICVGILKAVPQVVSCWRACDEPCAVAAMSIGELAYGAEKSRDPEAERRKIERLSSVLFECDATKSVMLLFGRIKADLEAKGCRIADADIIIAATALESGMTLVTGNTKHFARIPELKLENWFSD